MKNDERDAQDLAAMLAIGRLAEGWIAPPPVRELRELMRYRYSLIRHRTSAKAQIHGVSEAYARRLDSLRNPPTRSCTAARSPKRAHRWCAGRPSRRWGATRAKGNEKLRADYRRIAEHRGKYKARVAVARKLLTLVFYALRDGEVRCLESAA